MADPVRSANDVSAGTYRCTNCGFRLRVEAATNMPPCPECMNGLWATEDGGDPDPNRG